MNDSQLFMLVFMQNVLNFLVLYFFNTRYSRIVNDMNVHFEKTTKLFLDHLSDMYEYGSDYWLNTRRSYREDEDDDHNNEEETEHNNDVGNFECEDEQECGEGCGEDSEEECDTQNTCSEFSSSYPQEEELFAQNCN